MDTPTPMRVYRLDPILDDPRYAGFRTPAIRFETVPRRRTTRNWRVARITRIWKPVRVDGPVRKFNDFPSILFGPPIFSARAVEALRDLLEPNGELLPLKSRFGDYFAYNTTKVADVLDLKRSDIAWLKKPVRALEVFHYEFILNKLAGLSIFRLPEKGNIEHVTETFVARANQHQLRGFNFKLVWPLPPGVSWMSLNKQRLTAIHKEALPKGQTAKGRSIEIRLKLKSVEPSSAERSRVKKLTDQLNAQLEQPNSTAPAMGYVEWPHYCRTECRLPISCPDLDKLLKHLRPWLKTLKWPGGFTVLKRYGSFDNLKARKEVVRI